MKSLKGMGIGLFKRDASFMWNGRHILPVHFQNGMLSGIGCTEMVCERGLFFVCFNDEKMEMLDVWVELAYVCPECVNGVCRTIGLKRPPYFSRIPIDIQSDCSKNVTGSITGRYKRKAL